MNTISNTETLERHINQNGVRPGARKLEQFKKALTLRGTPHLYTQDGWGEAIVYVKLFDPSGFYTWFITEWDQGDNQCFGLVNGVYEELGYFDLEELANVSCRLSIGIEIDVHFLPTTMKEVRKNLRD